MWTDGRYYIQIERELYQGWKMMKMEKEAETIHQYIEKNLPKNIKIGMDYNLFSQGSFIFILPFLFRKCRYFF